MPLHTTALTRRHLLTATSLALLPGWASAQAARPIRLDRALPARAARWTSIARRWPSGEGQPGHRGGREPPGAGGNLGADLVAKAAPDGHTLVMGAVATHAINPWLYSRLPYDPVRDFTPITRVAQVPNVLVMNADTAERLKIRSAGRPGGPRARQPRPAELRLRRQRQRRPPGRRDVQDPGRRLHRAHPLRRRPRRSWACCRARWTSTSTTWPARRPTSRRQAQGTGGDHRHGATAMPDLPTVAEAGRSLGRASMSAPGSACSAPPACRSEVLAR
jgi:hypothetical protein